MTDAGKWTKKPKLVGGRFYWCREAEFCETETAVYFTGESLLVPGTDVAHTLQEFIRDGGEFWSIPIAPPTEVPHD